MSSRVLAIMPVKDEANRYLEEVLAHLIGVVGLDNIFVYDDQSTDGTFDLVSDLGICVARRGDDTPGFEDHEGRFRQWGWNCFQQALRPEPGDWVLAQDADEMLFGHERLGVLTKQEDVDVLGISFVHMWNPTQYRVDKLWAPTVAPRMFRYFPDGEFARRKLASGSEPTYVRRLISHRRVKWETGLVMKHLGYVRDVDKKAKYERYMRLDGGDYHARAHLESILDEKPTLVPWTLS